MREMKMPTPAILVQSVQSLLLRLWCQDEMLGTATGFVAESKRGPVLITNRHNVTGAAQETGTVISQSGLCPDRVEIIHNRANRPGEWILLSEPLYAESVRLWHEHPVLKQKADFVALPLTQLQDVQLYPYTLGTKDPLVRCGPADIVSVIGFPFGMQAGGSLAIWATGFVASEPAIDFNNLPIILIDCRTRPGQSGSAVIAYRGGGWVPMEDGSSNYVTAAGATRFMGIYSGRINAQSDIGMVWKAAAIRELVDSL
jgi:Trypsin-like peptidase domain